MACAAVMLACKLEERNMPQLEEFIYITDNMYSKEEFLAAERALLSSIDFNIHRPNPYIFLRRFARVLDAGDKMVQFMSRFLLEAGLHSHSISLFPESKKAAAVLWLSRVVLRNSSYKTWLKQPDVLSFRRFIHDNQLAKNFYANCEIFIDGSSSGSTHPNESSNLFPGNISESINDSCGTLCRIFSDSLMSTSNPDMTIMDSYDCEELDVSLKQKIRSLKSEDALRRPYWPVVLKLITGYDEHELIPLALKYHYVAMMLLAEVSKGSLMEHLRKKASEEVPIDMSMRGIKSNNNPTIENVQVSQDSSSSNVSSSSEFMVRRVVVTKYCNE